MRVVVMEDYQRAVERLDAFGLLDGHDVVVHFSRPESVAERAAQIGDAEALVLIRERTPVDARPCLSISSCLASLVRAIVPPYVDVSAVSARREGRHGRPREGQARS